MAEPKWTPGPWYEVKFWDGRNQIRARVGHREVVVANDVSPGDVPLILAVHDLRESLELAIEKLREYADMDRWSQGEGGGCMSDPDEFIREAVEKGEAALAKVRGETT